MTIRENFTAVEVGVRGSIDGDNTARFNKDQQDMNRRVDPKKTFKVVCAYYRAPLVSDYQSFAFLDCVRH